MSRETTCKVCDLYGPDETPRCHRCGHMPNREILPGCWGTAVSATDGFDKSRCHCPGEENREAPLVRRMEAMETQIDAIRVWARSLGYDSWDVLAFPVKGAEE